MANYKIKKNNVPALIKSVSGRILGEAVLKGALILETEVKTSMATASHSGRTYKGHKASAPGETPATDTGVLINSLISRLESATPKRAKATFGPTVEYGVYLEYGTSKMEKRPYLRPAFDKKLSTIESTIREYVTSKLKGASQ